MLKVFASLALLSLVSSPPAEELRRESLMQALGTGGYTIILRHARTDRSIPTKETPGYTPASRADQRNLTADGVRDGKVIGAALRKHKVPIGEIISSPLFRTVETAELAAGKPTTTTMVLRVFPATAEQAALVAAPPKSGTNRLLVTHHFVIETHVPGIKPGDIDEGEAVVVRSGANGKVELVGRITLSDWKALAGVEPAPASNRSTAPGVSSSTPAEIAAAYVSAFNTGSSERMRTFIETYLLVNPERPIEARLESYETAFKAYAPLALEKVQSADASEAVLEMKSRQGDLRLVVKAAQASPGRAASLSLLATQGGGHR